jgi:hypothetical protein
VDGEQAARPDTAPVELSRPAEGGGGPDVIPEGGQSASRATIEATTPTVGEDGALGTAWVLPSSGLGLGAVALGGALVLWALWQRWTQGRRAGLARERVREESVVSARAGLATRVLTGAAGDGQGDSGGLADLVHHGDVSRGTTAGMNQGVATSEAALRETTRELAAGLDAKGRELAALIAAADERLEALRAHGGTASGRGVSGQPGGNSITTLNAGDQSGTGLRAGGVDQRARGEGARMVEMPHARASGEGVGALGGWGGQGAATPHREVLELADQGLSPVEIAQRLGKPTGQVELVLNLRRATLVG